MMFRQLLINLQDRRFQLIPWGESPDDPVVVYELNTNTYGLTSSPFIATRSLPELADQERIRFPCAAAVLLGDLYVDDVCTGELRLRRRISCATSSSPFSLLQVMSCESGYPMIRVYWTGFRTIINRIRNSLRTQRILIWSRYLVCSTNQWPTSLPSERRWMLQRLGPRGRVCPLWPGCMIPMVGFARSCSIYDDTDVIVMILWTLCVSWDEPLEGCPLDGWLDLVSKMGELNQVALPRRILPSGKYHTSLHGFCDASKRG